MPDKPQPPEAHEGDISPDKKRAPSDRKVLPLPDWLFRDGSNQNPPTENKDPDQKKRLPSSSVWR